MNDIISGIAGQTFQQALQNQTAKQQTSPESTGRRSFESYLQQNGGTETNGGQVDQTQQTSGISGADLQKQLDQMQVDLAQKFNQSPVGKDKVNQMIPDLSDSKTRLSLLKEAYSKVGDTSKVTNDLSGRFTQVETEYKNVESIMKSDKNLSPGELLALQARLYQVSQHIEVMTKVVDQMAGGIKTVINTNV